MSLDINDIRREQAMAEIIAQRDLMILGQHAEMIKANETIAEQGKKILELEKKLQETAKE
jgi:hypothetical protein